MTAARQPIEFTYDGRRYRASARSDGTCIAEEWDEDDWIVIALTGEPDDLVRRFLSVWLAVPDEVSR